MLHWNGTAWSLALLPFTGNPTVNPSQAGSALFAITAISPTDVWAADATNNTDLLALTEHYNGTTWAIVPSLQPGDSNGLLRDPLTDSPGRTLLATGTESLIIGCCNYAFAERDTHG